MVRARYETAANNHHPMEPHVAVCWWEGDHVVVHTCTQAVFGTRSVVTHAFGLPPDGARVVSRLLGGGFGCKGALWFPWLLLTMLAAKRTGRPVRLELTRAQMFTLVGRRSATVQDIALAADAHGRLAAIDHRVLAQTSTLAEYADPVGMVSQWVYRCPHVSTAHRSRAPTSRTPSRCAAPARRPAASRWSPRWTSWLTGWTSTPWSFGCATSPTTTNGRACRGRATAWLSALRSGRREVRMAAAARRAGMAGGRTPDRPRGRGRLLSGAPAAVRHADASGRTRGSDRRVRHAGHGLGHAHHDRANGGRRARVADRASGGDDRRYCPAARPDLGRIAGDAELRAGAGGRGGRLKRALSALLPPSEAAACEAATSAVEVSAEGRIRFGASNASWRLDELLTGSGLDGVEGYAEAPGLPAQPKATGMGFGSVFAEVEVDPVLASIRVRRITAAFAAGRIVNHTLAHSQYVSGLVGGLGMALHEEVRTDANCGRIVGPSLAEYLVPTHADMPTFDIVMVDEVDEHLPGGIKGVGMLGHVGSAAAIANALAAATGGRVRRLPIRVEDVLAVTPSL